MTGKRIDIKDTQQRLIAAKNALDGAIHIAQYLERETSKAASKQEILALKVMALEGTALMLEELIIQEMIDGGYYKVETLAKQLHAAPNNVKNMLAQMNDQHLVSYDNGTYRLRKEFLEA